MLAATSDSINDSENSTITANANTQGLRGCKQRRGLEQNAFLSAHRLQERAKLTGGGGQWWGWQRQAKQKDGMRDRRVVCPRLCPLRPPPSLLFLPWNLPSLPSLCNTHSHAHAKERRRRRALAFALVLLGLFELQTLKTLKPLPVHATSS